MNHEAPNAQTDTVSPMSNDSLGPPTAWVMTIHTTATAMAPAHERLFGRRGRAPSRTLKK